MIVKAEGLTLRYDNVRVFSNISFTVRGGEALILTGRNGSGKTSLLKIISGIIPWIKQGKVTGEIRIDGLNPLENPDPLAYKVRMLPPDPQQFLLAPTPYDDIGFSLSILGMSSVKERIGDIASRLAFTDILFSPVLELSSGQQQKTAIASTIAPGVKCLLLDEPISHLDWIEKDNLLKLIREFKNNGFCFIIATHYPEYFYNISDAILTLGEHSSEYCDNKDYKVKTENDQRVVLKAADISYVYPNGNTVLRKINLSLLKGEILVVYGRNGSGKSTLLYTLAGVLKPSTGCISFESKPAILPPDPVKVFTMPTLRKELSSYNPDPSFIRAFDVDGLMNRPLNYLSTGELKKSALTVLFATGSRILLMDEPEAGLDPISRCRLAKLITRLSSLGASVIVATHDKDFGHMIATRELVLEEGELRSVA
ncbi:MAG: ATP-binding cassette domain-containing protein [Desulfurococcales archaeon]|nr:ATP-binding cassette domain-containing protein [Desulfurococcales archaeon]